MKLFLPLTLLFLCFHKVTAEGNTPLLLHLLQIWHQVGDRLDTRMIRQRMRSLRALSMEQELCRELEDLINFGPGGLSMRCDCSVSSSYTISMQCQTKKPWCGDHACAHATLDMVVGAHGGAMEACSEYTQPYGDHPNVCISFDMDNFGAMSSCDVSVQQQGTSGFEDCDNCVICPETSYAGSSFDVLCDNLDPDLTTGRCITELEMDPFFFPGLERSDSFTLSNTFWMFSCAFATVALLLVRV